MENNKQNQPNDHLKDQHTNKTQQNKDDQRQPNNKDNMPADQERNQNQNQERDAAIDRGQSTTNNPQTQEHQTQEHQTQQDQQRYDGSKNPKGMDTDMKGTNTNRDIVNDQDQENQKYFED